ncbi:MAG: UBA/THIF-type binding protein [Deltaproteobacteria bacterium]|nr:UBA/THIF-type binding protein [Deltaproteobacteria bacterium]
MPTFDTLLRDLRGKTPEIEAAVLGADLAASADSGPAMPAVIDVRETDEHVQGMIPGAVHIPRGYLEIRIERTVPDRETPVVLYCASGQRSVLAVRSLLELGYTNVRSLAGGFTSWKRAGLPWEQPAALRADQQTRYSRHTLIPEIGVAGQLKLLKAKVLCIGAGGLGSPSSMYLAAAGIGTLGLVDDDVVDASNLQRQILHCTDRIGTPKVESAERTLRGLNPDVKVDKHRTRITSDNALELIAGYDVVIDGADNFATRYLVNDCALRLGKPVVHASIFRFEGQITVFPGAGSPCYRCLYPSPPPAEEAPSCAEAGVLGVLPGIMGVMQATEAIKLVLGLGDTLAGRLVLYDALKTRFRELKLRRDPKCLTCGDGVDRGTIPLIDYEQFCAGPKH